MLIVELFGSDDDNVGMVVGVGVRSSANIAAILSDGLPPPPQQSSCNSRLCDSGKIQNQGTTMKKGRSTLDLHFLNDIL